MSTIFESLGLGLGLGINHQHINTLRHKFDQYVFLIKPRVYTLEQPYLYRQPIIKPIACIFGTQLQLSTHCLPTLQLIHFRAPHDQRTSFRVCFRRRPARSGRCSLSFPSASATKASRDVASPIVATCLSQDQPLQELQAGQALKSFRLES